MKKLLPVACMMILAWQQAEAQQDPLYAQYMFNPLLINPGYAGLNNNFNALVSYRTQWVGLAGQPQTINASAHSSLVQNRVGTGLVVVNDKIGNTLNTEANASVAYKLQLDKMIVSFGMQAGVQHFRSDAAGLNLLDPGDNTFAGGERGAHVNLGAGAILKTEKYFISLSVPRLLPTSFENGGQEFTLYNQHAYLMGSSVHYVNEHIRLKPAVLFRGVRGAPISADLTLSLSYNEVHTAGIFTRNFGTYGVLLQTLLKEQLRLGYAFEVPTNKSIGQQFTTHEIVLGVRLSAFAFHERSLGSFW